MNKDAYTDTICKSFCIFYKEGKEDLFCGTYRFLMNNLTSRELHSLLDMLKIRGLNISPDFSRDAEIKKLVCSACDFLIDGCDFRDNGSHPPCGGYILVERLLNLLV